ncbi:hypothetical protein [Roseisolibacter sp. H3M3-2]|uniref:hypothetical protein n=1 Tax=Roseisolibacter sp. H3M3-2 TaxID=3031323 RepID=UPI0023DCDE43|nr:hypothetical protein [Roseisolibacter sp. H3M3-2]MDF1501799.1 hypothetical protein [Roseisolibacter sp. H3M3-2]
MPIPDGVRGSRAEIRLVVDAAGRPLADSVTVCGVADQRYAARLARAAAQLSFRPAQQGGRAVAAPARLRYEL